MGFFKDFKRDFAQAVNELMPDRDELAEEYDDEDMVNTFDENDNMDIAPEDMLEDIDDFKLDNLAVGETAAERQTEKPESDYDDDNIDEPVNEYDAIPDAEVINDASSEIYDDDIESYKEPELVTEILVAEPAEEPQEDDGIKDIEKDAAEENGEDELVSEDMLDEEDMLEGMEDANAVESASGVSKSEPIQMDLNKDVMDAILMRKDNVEDEVDDEAEKEDNMSETEIKPEANEQDISSILNDDTTYITKGTSIKGNIETDGGVDIIGTVEGDVSCGGKLIVGGTIKGSIKVGELYANAAKLEGDVTVSGSAKIGVGTVVVGNVAAESAVIAGAVNGDIDVKGPVIVDSTAVIMGNIKSRSVQINNGAVIEGFCSQCYSEIDVKSFFE